MSIWMYSCWGCLRPPLGRHIGDGALRDLEKGLLNALARHIAGDGGVVALAGDLVDLVDADDAALSCLHIAVGGLKKPQEDVLHILADIPRLGQRRGVGDSEGDLEIAGEGLGQKGLAAACRADGEDIALARSCRHRCRWT